MYELIDINAVKETHKDTQLIITIPGKHLEQLLLSKAIKKGELRIDDGRHISAEQRKKAYATIRDIADYTGDLPETAKENMKYRYIEQTGSEYISFSDCSIDDAREFINFLMEFVIENGIPLSAPGIERAEDVGKYLYYCIKNRKCCICGTDGEIHHVDAIGMGNDRTVLDDSNHRKICLCRKHHTQAHSLGNERFMSMYKVYGITVKKRP